MTSLMASILALLALALVMLAVVLALRSVFLHPPFERDPDPPKIYPIITPMDGRGQTRLKGTVIQLPRLGAGDSRKGLLPGPKVSRLGPGSTGLRLAAGRNAAQLGRGRSTPLLGPGKGH